MDGSRLAAEPDEAGPSSGMNGSCLVAAPDKAGPSSEVTEDDDIAEVEAAAEARMASIHRAFSAAKAKGVTSATRLMKELRQVTIAGTFEVELLNDDLQAWEVTLFDWVFDTSSPLHRDLAEISAKKADLVAIMLRMTFPDDFPFAPPLVYVSQPALRSEYVFDGALCLEMLVDWQPQYGNVEAMLVQICAFLANSGARVEAACAGDGGGGAKAAATQESARRAYQHLKEFHDKKGWSSAGR